MEKINMEEPILNSHNKAEYEPAHTAEHILNRTMVNMFGCLRSRNAHVERKKSKCDYLLAECPTDAQVSAIEAKVNEIIAAALPVTVAYMSREEASSLLDLSKLPEDASDTLRIVRIGDYDDCACIGAHVGNTSEIGEFRIISHDFNDGVWRVRWKVIVGPKSEEMAQSFPIHNERPAHRQYPFQTTRELSGNTSRNSSAPAESVNKIS